MGAIVWFKGNLSAIVSRTRRRRPPPEQHLGLKYFLQGNEHSTTGRGSPRRRLPNFIMRLTTEIKVDTLSSDGFQNVGFQKGLNEELINTVFGHNFSESDEESSSSTSSDSPPIKWVYEEDNWDFRGALPWLFSDDDSAPIQEATLDEILSELKDLNKGPRGYMTPKTEEVDTTGLAKKSFWKEPPQVPIEISQILTSGCVVRAAEHSSVV